MVEISKNKQEVEKESPPPSLSSFNSKGGKIIEGYALKFNQRSKKLGNYYEVISSNALNGVDLSDVKCLVDHDYSKVLGRTTADTLRLEVDKIGLKFTCIIPNTSYANDLYESINRGDITECSFEFTLNEKNKLAQTIARLSDGTYLRTINQFKDLREVSIVSNPAYFETSAKIKRDYQNAIDEFEANLIKTEIELLSL